MTRLKLATLGRQLVGISRLNFVEMPRLASGNPRLALERAREERRLRRGQASIAELSCRREREGRRSNTEYRRDELEVSKADI